MHTCNTVEVNLGFLSSSYVVEEGAGFVDVEFGVLAGKINRDISVDFTFRQVTAQGKAYMYIYTWSHVDALIKHSFMPNIVLPKKILISLVKDKQLS